MIGEKTRKKLSLKKLGNKNPNWVGGKPRCLICGKKVSRYKGVKYCSGCYGKTCMGENNPSWKGGVNSDKKHKNRLTLNWYHNHKDYFKNRNLIKRFGISLEEYNLISKNQSGKCAICGCKSTKKKLAVDHCHETKKIRGLLCDACNLGLGKFNDDNVLLKKALDYIKRNKKSKRNVGL